MRVLNAKKVQMVAGEYYVGDPCYVMDEASFLGFNKITDIYDFLVSSDRRAVSFPTIRGDGIFYDNFGNRYLVDSGSLSVKPRDAIIVNDLTANMADRVFSILGLPYLTFGRIFRFDVPFNCELNDQRLYLRIGKIEIDLRGQPTFLRRPPGGTRTRKSASPWRLIGLFTNPRLE